MQESIRKELKNLCLDILKQEDSAELSPLIEQCQTLLQKLLVADYMEQSSPKQGSVSDEVEETPSISEEEPKSTSSINVSAEDFVAKTQVETTEPKEEAVEEKEAEASPIPEQFKPKNTISPEAEQSLGLSDFQPTSPPPVQNSGSINERFAQGSINFGLNDRIAFVKHLFGNDMNDFNRVVSQLNTFEDFQEAEQFIENMVKPDYDWQQKEEYEMRFKNRIRQRFGLDELK
jgi:hypothetical protein